MWYYIKDNNSKGPIADSAIMNLFKSGEIDKNTLVRTGNGKAWKRFKMTRFYSRLGRKRSMHLETLEVRTKLVRAFLTSFFIIISATLLLYYTRWNDLMAILAGEDFSDLTLKIMRSDYRILSRLSGAIMLSIFLITIYSIMRWLGNVTFNAKMLDKQFEFSPTVAAWSLLFPVVNFIHPFIVISTVYKSAKGVTGVRYTIYDAVFIFLWWFFSLFSVFIFVMDKWFFKIALTLDRAEAVLVFNIYAVVIFAFTISLWILLVTRISKLQKTAFSMDL